MYTQREPPWKHVQPRSLLQAQQQCGGLCLPGLYESGLLLRRKEILMNREMEHINVLAGEIGYRVATTEREHRAANYIEQELHNYGLQDVRQQSFRLPTQVVSAFFPYFLALLSPRFRHP